jgi:hypothetical protein
MALKQEEFKDSQELLYKFKDIQGLEFLFSNSEDIQVLYEPSAMGILTVVLKRSLFISFQLDYAQTFPIVVRL